MAFSLTVVGALAAPLRIWGVGKTNKGFTAHHAAPLMKPPKKL
jgi:hypothetical protein